VGAQIANLLGEDGIDSLEADRQLQAA
jgi:hypothetical protein